MWEQLILVPRPHNHGPCTMANRRVDFQNQQSGSDRQVREEAVVIHPSARTTAASAWEVYPASFTADLRNRIQYRPVARGDDPPPQLPIPKIVFHPLAILFHPLANLCKVCVTGTDRSPPPPWTWNVDDVTRAMSKGGCL